MLLQSCPTSSSHPRADRPAASAQKLGHPQAHGHLPKTMPPPPMRTLSVPQVTPFSKHLEFLGVAQVSAQVPGEHRL